MEKAKLALEGTSWPTEKVRVDRALMRVSSGDVRSLRDLPPRSVAAMDGYAVRQRDLKGAAVDRPVTLTVVGSVRPYGIGSAKGAVGPGEALQVATGAPMPAGADLVVKEEDVRALEGSGVEVSREFPRWKNVSLSGEDVRKGSVILRRSQTVTAASLALCLACSTTTLRVKRRPRAGVLSVGSELVEFPRPAKSKHRVGPFNNYSNMVRGYLEARGVETVSLGICEDGKEDVRLAIEKGLEIVDVITTIAGSSVGEYDLVSEALESIPGSELLFHGIRAVPIKPTGLAIVRRKGVTKPVVILPGHAVSAALATFAVALPVVNMLSGQDPDFGRVSVVARTEEELANRRPLDAYFLMKLRREDGSLVATPLKWGSNLLGSLSEASGFVRLGANKKVEASSSVEVELLGPAELARVGASGRET